jgi:adenosylcobinamide-GDP ribazoletransferase
MIRFYSRLPLPRLPFESEAHAPPDFRRAPRLLPLAAFVIGLPSAFALAAALWLGLPPLVAATLAVAAAALSTGAFHEDGLADSFDGLGGGWTRERRLEIMRDSRIGSYGATALLLALASRIGCLSALAERTGPLPAALALVAAAVLSRPVGLMPLALLPPARADGVSALAGRPGMGVFGFALGLGLAMALLLGRLGGLSAAGALLGFALAIVLAGLMTAWARRSIGGQTGDIAGACEQLAEIAFLCGLLISLPHVPLPIGQRAAALGF